MKDETKTKDIPSIKEGSIKCAICGQHFDPGNLVTVLAHHHNEEINPALALGIKGKRVS